MKRVPLSFLFAAFAMGLSGCGDGSYESADRSEAGDSLAWIQGDPTWPDKVPDGPIDFKKHVRPLLIINCLECHNREDAPRNGNFILETRALAMSTGSAPAAWPSAPCVMRRTFSSASFSFFSQCARSAAPRS